MTRLTDTEMLLKKFNNLGVSFNYSSAILELGQDATNSFGKHLNVHDYFLLSENTNDSELSINSLHGAFGHVDAYGKILIPSGNVDYKLFKQTVYKKCSNSTFEARNNHRDINYYNKIICNGFSPDLINLGHIYTDKILGFCCDSMDFNYKREMLKLYEELIILYDDNYDIYTERLTEINKEIYVLKRKK